MYVARIFLSTSLAYVAHMCCVSLSPSFHLPFLVHALPPFLVPRRNTVGEEKHREKVERKFFFLKVLWMNVLPQAESMPMRPQPRRSGRICQGWLIPVIMGSLVFSSCQATNVYELLLLLKYKEGETAAWKAPFCIGMVAVQLVIFIMAFWGFFTCIFTPPGRVEQDPWSYVPIPAGRVPPSRQLMEFYEGERMKQEAAALAKARPLMAEQGSACAPAPTGDDLPPPVMMVVASPLPSRTGSNSPVQRAIKLRSAKLGAEVSSPASSAHPPAAADTKTCVVKFRPRLPSFLSSVADWPTPNKHLVLQREIPRGVTMWTPSAYTDPRTGEEHRYLGPQNQELRYCAECGLFKPDYARHCRICGHCVFHFDHHCHFVNNCIGRNNFRSFVSFTMYGFLCGIHIVSVLIAIFAVDSRVWADKGIWIAVPIVQGPLWLFLTALFWQCVTFVHLALHSVDLTVARGHHLYITSMSRYYRLLNTTYEERKAEYDQELFGSKKALWKFLSYPVKEWKKMLLPLLLYIYIYLYALLSASRSAPSERERKESTRCFNAKLFRLHSNGGIDRGRVFLHPPPLSLNPCYVSFASSLLFSLSLFFFRLLSRLATVLCRTTGDLPLVAHQQRLPPFSRSSRVGRQRLSSIYIPFWITRTHHPHIQANPSLFHFGFTEGLDCRRWTRGCGGCYRPAPPPRPSSLLWLSALRWRSALRRSRARFSRSPRGRGPPAAPHTPGQIIQQRDPAAILPRAEEEEKEEEEEEEEEARRAATAALPTRPSSGRSGWYWYCCSWTSASAALMNAAAARLLYGLLADHPPKAALHALLSGVGVAALYWVDAGRQARHWRRRHAAVAALLLEELYRCVDDLWLCAAQLQDGKDIPMPLHLLPNSGAEPARCLRTCLPILLLPSAANGRGIEREPPIRDDDPQQTDRDACQQREALCTAMGEDLEAFLYRELQHCAALRQPKKVWARQAATQLAAIFEHGCRRSASGRAATAPPPAAHRSKPDALAAGAAQRFSPHLLSSAPSLVPCDTWPAVLGALRSYLQCCLLHSLCHRVAVSFHWSSPSAGVDGSAADNPAGEGCGAPMVRPAEMKERLSDFGVTDKRIVAVFVALAQGRCAAPTARRLLEPHVSLRYLHEVLMPCVEYFPLRALEARARAVERCCRLLYRVLSGLLCLAWRWGVGGTVEELLDRVPLPGHRGPGAPNENLTGWEREALYAALRLLWAPFMSTTPPPPCVISAIHGTASSPRSSSPSPLPPPPTANTPPPPLLGSASADTRLIAAQRCVSLLSISSSSSSSSSEGRGEISAGGSAARSPPPAADSAAYADWIATEHHRIDRVLCRGLNWERSQALAVCMQDYAQRLELLAEWEEEAFGSSAAQPAGKTTLQSWSSRSTTISNGSALWGGQRRSPMSSSPDSSFDSRPTQAGTLTESSGRSSAEENRQPLLVPTPCESSSAVGDGKKAAGSNQGARCPPLCGESDASSSLPLPLTRACLPSPAASIAMPPQTAPHFPPPSHHPPLAQRLPAPRSVSFHPPPPFFAAAPSGIIPIAAGAGRRAAPPCAPRCVSPLGYPCGGGQVYDHFSEGEAWPAGVVRLSPALRIIHPVASQDNRATPPVEGDLASRASHIYTTA
eukprot:gene9750-6838_t